MPVVRHSVIREGIVTGILGAIVIAIWYFILDVVAHAPLRTPSVIGQLLLHGSNGVTPEVSPVAVVVATLVHGAGFVLLGILLTGMAHLAAREIEWRMGILIGLVIVLGFSAGMMFAITPATGERFPSWIIIAGSAFSVIAMASHIWRRHPALAAGFREVPLGDETSSPPHPPDR